MSPKSNLFLCIMVMAGSFGCDVSVPFNPGGAFEPVDGFFDDVEQSLDNLVEDPLGAKPFPVIVGGDNERVFYATNLTDVRLRFQGPGNDVVIPGFTGPSNLYLYEQKKRDLIRALIPSSAFLGIATDSDYIAYVRASETDESRFDIVASWVNLPLDVATIDGGDDGQFVVPFGLRLSEGRLVYLTESRDGAEARLNVEDLDGIEPSLSIEVGHIWSTDLRGERLVYVEGSTQGGARVVLRDLGTDEVNTIAELPRSVYWSEVTITLNSIVWSEGGNSGLQRVWRHDLASGETRLWADAVPGVLAGANDSYFVVEESQYNDIAEPTRIIVRKYDSEGRGKKLAEFRADGLAGQTTVLGDRVAWVNADRRVVVAPLSGGDRISFRPF